MREPMYDNMTLDWIAELENKDLIDCLWHYTLSLEENIVRLRNQINYLTKDDKPQPFPDPASDFSKRFFDHPSYHLYAEFWIKKNATI